MPIQIEEAESIVAACIRFSDQIGKAVAVAVVDLDGQLLYCRRHEAIRSVDLAIAKAYSAAVMGVPTRHLIEMSACQPVLFNQLSELGEYPIIADDGGVTIVRDGVQLGGVGVSGATGEEDNWICESALAEFGFEPTSR